MGKVILYLGLSLDGYIADKDGGYAFLNNYSDPSVYDYEAFLSRLGTIIMGRVSFDLTRKASPTWEFDGFKTYVYSRGDHQSTEKIAFTSLSPTELVKQIRSESDKDIWLFGGSEIIDLFVKENAIDEYWLYYVPEVLGSGIPLFKTSVLDRLSIHSIKQYDNIVEMKLVPKKEY